MPVPRLLLTLLGLVAAASSAAQEAAPPALREGDSWTFVQRDAFTGLEVSSSSVQVKAVRADGYQLEWTRPDGTDLRDLTLDLNTRQVVDSVAGDTAEFRFPLTAGKKWSSVVAYRNRANNVSGVYELEREVAGQESKKTPAGDFLTWKIVAKGLWILKSDPSKVAVSDFRGRYETTCWFAPAAKTCVVLETRSFAKGHVGNWFRWELTRLDLP